MNQTRIQSHIVCPLHPSEPIKGVCLAKESCDNRFLCRHCRRTHDNNHLNLYEELEELLNGNLAGDIMRGFNEILNNINNQQIQSNKNVQRLGKQVDTLFDRIQQFISQKLNQTRHAILEDIRSKFTVDHNKLKQTVVKAQDDLESSFNNAASQGFRSIPGLDNLVHVICSTDTLRQSISQDPSLDSKSINDLADRYLDPSTLNLLLKNVQSSFEGVCQDITDKLFTKQILDSNNMGRNKNFSENGRSLNQEMNSGVGDSMNLETHQQKNFFTNSPFAKFSFAQLNNQGNGLNFAPNPNLLKDGGNQLGNKSPSRLFLNDFGNNNNSFTNQNAGQSPFLKAQVSFAPQVEVNETPGASEGPKLQTIPGFASTNFSLAKPSPGRALNNNFFQNQDTQSTGAGGSFLRSGRSSTMKGEISSNNSLFQPLAENSFHNMQLERSKSPIQKHAAQDLLKIFQKVDSGNPSMKTPQGPIEIDDDPATPTVSKSALVNDPRKRQVTPQKAFRNQGFRKSGEVVEFEKVLHTQHKQIMSGAMVHISSRNQLITGGSEGQIKIWDLHKSQMVQSINAHKGEIFKLLYIEEKDMLVSSGLDNCVKVWDCRNNLQQVSYFRRHAGPVYAVEYIPDLNCIVSGGEESFLKFWTVENAKETPHMKTSDLKIGSLCYIRKSKRLAVGFDTGDINIIVLNGQNKKLAYALKGHNQYVFHLVYVEDANILVSGSDDGFVRFWKLHADRGECVKEFGVKNKIIKGIAVFSEKDLVVTNHSDNQVRVWNSSSGEPVAKHSDKSFGENLIRIKNSNKILTGNSNEVKLWSINY